MPDEPPETASRELARVRSALRARYRIERAVGRGGMATVYLAQDLRHDRPVAVKVLKPELVAALGPGRFQHEIKVTAKLSHPHILPLLDSGEVDGILFYVMPYVEGESLRQKLTRDGRTEVAEALTIARQVAGALDYAHRQGIVHRDIKPENILLHEGEAVVADFGIALALSAAGAERLTATGVSIGTPAYMSPEQIRGDRDLDGRSDTYALACVLHEMLTSEPPFAGPSIEAIIARRLTELAPRVTAARPGVPGHVDTAIRRALSESPNDRFPTPGEFVTALGETAAAPAPVSLTALARAVRHPGVLVPAALVVIASLIAVVVPRWFGIQRSRALARVPDIERLALERRFAEAYEILVSVERWLRADATVARLARKVSDSLTVRTQPYGARVYLQPFAPDANGRFPDSGYVGTTPLYGLRIPRVDHRLVVSREGYAPIERVVSSADQRILSAVEEADPIEVSVRLVAADSVPDGTVFVPGGEYELASPDVPSGFHAQLADYLIDRYEVTNADYAAFVRAGGYATREYWRVPFAQGGRPVPWEEAVRRLVDRTGLAGPRQWVGQEPPSGEERHPVRDVTWYEAAAYCAFRGKELPTVFEWEKAARDGQTTPGNGVVMPWGVVGLAEPGRHRANFGGSGTEPVDANPFGVSPYGAYAMAGNVKEWTRTDAGNGYLAMGGSWQDPMYTFSEYGTFLPWFTAPTIGVRCAKTVSSATGEQGAGRLALDRRTPTYTPVDERTFRTLLTHYRYDRQDLHARTVDVRETPDWKREEIRYAGVEGDSVTGYLYLPRQGQPPYQTLVYVASNGAFFQNALPVELEWMLGPHVRTGRAVFGVVFKGMLGREWGPGYTPPPPSSVRFRDLMVLHATELRHGLDYLETRTDIDTARLAYVGLSWGAGSRLVFAGVDERFRSVILIGGGIDERVHPTLPEASNINFAPYIEAPKLLLNGRQDEEHPYETRALPLWNLLREPKQLVMVDSAGHVPPPEARVPAINEWLDATLGPVRRAP